MTPRLKARGVKARPWHAPSPRAVRGSAPSWIVICSPCAREFADRGDAFDLTERVTTQSSPDHLIIQTGITDTSGVVTQASVSLQGKRIDLVDREHFRVHLDPRRDQLFISKPVVGRLSALCSVRSTRKLMSRAGDFAGVAVNSVSCDDLSRFYETADLDNGFVALAGLDGIIRGYGPLRPDLMGTDIGAKPGLPRPCCRYGRAR